MTNSTSSNHVTREVLTVPHCRRCQQLHVLHSGTEGLDPALQREELVAHDVHTQDEGQEEVPQEPQQSVSIMAGLQRQGQSVQGIGDLTSLDEGIHCFFKQLQARKDLIVTLKVYSLLLSFSKVY